MRKFLIELWHDLSKVNRTPQQQKNHEKILQLKQKGINFLNNNPLIIPFVLGVMVLIMTIALAIAVN